MSSGKSALFLGATGAVGNSLLIDLLKSGTFKTVTTVGRRTFEYNGPNKGALVQKIVDFEKLDDYKEVFVGSYDTIFCTLGTTFVEAGFAEDFVKINKEYVIKAAKLIKQQNPSVNLQFLYCSSAGANTKSSFLYMKTKGEIEKELGEIGFNKVSIFRPRVLKTNKVRDKAGFSEWWLFNLIDWFYFIVPKNAIVHADIVGKAMRRVANEDFDIDIDATILDNGTLIEEINHMQIYEIGENI